MSAALRWAAELRAAQSEAVVLVLPDERALAKAGHFIEAGIEELLPVDAPGGLITHRIARAVALARSRQVSTGSAWPWEVVDTCGDGMVTIDVDGSILSFSKGAQALLGFEPVEVIGRNVSALMPSPHRHRHGQYLKSYQETGLAKIIGRPRLLHARHRDGTLVPVVVSVREVEVDGRRLFVGQLRDQSQQRGLEAKLAEQRDALEETDTQVRSILEEAADGIVTIDDRGRILRFNEAARRLFGYRFEQVRHRNVTMLMSEELAAEHDGFLRRYVAGGAAQIIGVGRELEGRHCDGSLFPIDLSINRVTIAGRPRFTAVIRDLSERKRIENELVRAREDADRSASMKSDFLAVMSHEIRTPMNGVIGMLDVLADTELTEGQRNELELAQRSANSLCTILDDILDFSKIEAGRLSLESVPVMPRELVVDATKVLRARASAKKIELRTRIDGLTPQRILGDPVRLQQILLNFLSNAVKFTASGSVEVRVKPLTVDGNSVLRFSVVDTGIGIHPDQLGHVFERFIQAESSTTRRFGGTGLGLTICKRLAEMMGGSIGAQSEEGIGSRFWLEIPMRVATVAEHPLAPDYADEEIDVTGMRVLVAEDNDVNRRVIRELLRNLGVHAEVVSSGSSAVERTCRARYDLVFLDMHMPDIDGPEAARRIRALPSVRAKTPLLALSASALQEDRDVCAQAGMNEFVAKPINKARLLKVLQRWAPNKAREAAQELAKKAS